MKIAFVTPEFVTEHSYSGGLSNYIDKISLAFLERGHEIYVLVSSDHDESFFDKGRFIVRVDQRSKLLSKIAASSYKDYYLPFLHVMHSWNFQKIVDKYDKTYSFDVIQYASYTSTALFAKKEKSVARLSSFAPLMHKHYEIQANPLALKLEEILELHALKKVKKIFGPSKLIAEEIEKRIHKQVEIIESPLLDIETIAFDDSIYMKNLQGKKYLIYFGTLGLLKGVKEIADILQKLFAQYPDMYFVFIGWQTFYNEQPMFNYILEHAKGFEHRCIYLERMKREQLLPCVQGAYAVVLPSRIDNFPNTCTESMMLGKIVVGTFGTSFEQLIEDRVSGYLCEPYNPESLLSTIKDVLALNMQEKEQIESNALRVVERLKPDKIAEELEKFYYKHITNVNDK